MYLDKLIETLIKFITIKNSNFLDIIYLYSNENLTFTATNDPIDPVGLAAVTGVYTNLDVPIEQTGYCMTWGQHHYRTFDGKVYRFQGECSYTLVEDRQHFFSVVLHNAVDCTSTSCPRLD